MKFLFLGFILTEICMGSQVRTLFFNEGKFRLKCQISDKSNRCSREMFEKTAQDLCKSKDLNFKNLGPIVCIDDLDTSKEFCKFANGECEKKTNSAEQTSEDSFSSPDKTPEKTQ